MESHMVQNSRNKIGLMFNKFQERKKGQERFQSSSTKSFHVQPIFSQGQDIWIQGQQNKVLTFNKFPFKGKTYLQQSGNFSLEIPKSGAKWSARQAKV